MSAQNIIKSVRLLIARGEFEEAGKLLFGMEDLKENVQAQALGARILSYTDGFDKAQSMFFDLEVVWPDNFEVYKMHSQLLQEQGSYNEAIALGRKLCKKFKDNIESYIIQSDNYELAGMPQEALNVCQEAISLFGDNAQLSDRITRLSDTANINDVIIESLEEVKSELNVKPLCASDENASLILRLFKSRNGVHAIQGKNGKKQGYFPVHRDMEFSDIKAHLKGEKTLGIYVTETNNTSSFMVMDLDIKKPYLSAYANSSIERNRLNNLLRESCRSILAICQSFSLLPLIEFSGNKGYHLWFFCKDSLECKHWRALAQWILNQQKIQPEELSWEVFPKQNRVSSDGIGNLVKLPLGIHQKTGRRSWFVDGESFEPYPDQFMILKNYAVNSKSDLEQILNGITIEKCCIDENNDFLNNIEFKPANIVKENSLNSEEQKDFTIDVKITLPERNTLEVEKILSGCSPLWNILEKAKREHHLEENEKHVLVSIFSLIGDEGKVFVHQVLNQTDGYQPDVVNSLIKRVSPNAMSCKKLRKTIPGICGTCACDCNFRLPDGCYSSPVIHAGIFPGTGATPSGVSYLRQPAKLSDSEMIGGESGGIDRLMMEYNDINEQINRLQARALLLKRQINRIFSEAGKDTIETRIRTYQRLPE